MEECSMLVYKYNIDIPPWISAFKYMYAPIFVGCCLATKAFISK